MSNLDITFTGTVKFHTVRKFENGVNLHEYLVQATNQADKVSSITVKYFTQFEHKPFSKDTQMRVKGYLQENKYKDSNDVWKSSGLQVIAEMVGVPADE